MLVESKKKNAIRKNPLGRPKVTCTSLPNGAAKIQINPQSAKTNLQQPGLTHQLFYLGEPARLRGRRFQASQTHVKKAFVKKRRFQKPRRRAVRSNVFGSTHDAIPRDAKRQAESPSRPCTHSRQKHNRSHPSRDTRSNQLSLSRRRKRSPRPTVFPRRESPHTEFPRRFTFVLPLWLQTCNR